MLTFMSHSECDNVMSCASNLSMPDAVYQNDQPRRPHCSSCAHTLFSPSSRCRLLPASPTRIARISHRCRPSASPGSPSALVLPLVFHPRFLPLAGGPFRQLSSPIRMARRCLPPSSLVPVAHTRPCLSPVLVRLVSCRPRPLWMPARVSRLVSHHRCQCLSPASLRPPLSTARVCCPVCLLGARCLTPAVVQHIPQGPS